MEKDIGKINKGEYQGAVTEIVIGIREYNGKVGLDIREYVSSEKYTGPTKKGLRIPAEKFDEFKKMIDSIKESDLAAPEGQDENQGQKSAEEEKSSSEGSEEMPDY